MKKAFYFFVAAVAAMAVSCTQEIAEPSEEQVVKSGVTVFRAYTETGTKTFLGGADGKQIYWSQGDKISLFCGSDTENHMLESNVVQSAAVADFTTEMSGLSPDFLAIYPYSEEYSRDDDGVWLTVPVRQTPYPGTFDPAAFISLAKSSNQDLRFYNLCGGFKIRFTQEGVNSLLIQSNNGESLAGYVKVAIDEDNHPYVIKDYGNDELTVCPPDGDASFSKGVDYFVSVLPGILADGVTFTLYIADGLKLGESQYNGSREIKRSVFACPKDFDEGITLECPEPGKVDLGLSVQWADCNLGGSSPTDYGYYFAWGETLPKAEYSWNTYKWGTSSALTKYNTGGDVLDADDDAAKALLGGAWRTPTSAEIQELIDGCNWEFQMQGSERVIVGTSKSDPSKAITLPMSGWIRESYLSNAGNTGRASLWASDIEASNHANANEFYCRYSSPIAPTVYNVERCYGLPIRPVYMESTAVSVVKLNKTEATIYEGASIQLTAEIIPSTAVNKSVTWQTSDQNVAYVTDTGEVYGITQGSATIIATSVDGGKKATCTVTVLGYETPEPVDLGLSVKWGSFNLGGAKPSDWGAFFAWGELNPKETYDSNSYSWNNGYLSGLTRLTRDDDAAADHLGGYWRMPTKAELQELIDNTTWTSGTVDGVQGKSVQSTIPGFTNKSIFIPMAGSMDGETNKDEVYCAIWSSDLYSTYQAWSLLDWNLITFRACYRGIPIRPVYCNPADVVSVSLDRSEIELDVSESTQLTATVLPETATDKLVFWTSSDTEVATVNGSGLVTGKYPGTATITATTRDGSRTATCSVTVKGMDIKFSDRNTAYWVDDIEQGTYNTIRLHAYIANAWRPDNNPADNDDVSVYKSYLSNFWVGNQIKVLLNGNVVTDGSIKYKFVFSKDQPYIDGRKWTGTEDQNDLYYNGSPAVSFDSYGDGILSYVWDEDPLYPSKVLLNYWAPDSEKLEEMLYCNVDLVAYQDAPEYAELYKEQIHVRFLRPINITSNSTSILRDAIPTGDAIYLGDLFKLRDWNRSFDPEGFLLFKKDTGDFYRSCYYPNEDNQSTARVYWYYYYGVSTLSINVDGILTNQNGSWTLIKKVNPAAKFWIAPPDDHTDQTVYDISNLDISDVRTLSDIVFVYFNNVGVVENFSIRVPISIGYTWGVVSDYVEMSVQGTKYQKQ
ncbi:MAG: Ig-like domain-containing protein [Bacteroidales bacterium]|nr:Ig-like domain-containing protein [Bacteroidales bacterium]